MSKRRLSRRLTFARSTPQLYAEPPYCEDTSDVDEFADAWAKRQTQPNFRLLVARQNSHAIAFAFGHELTVETRWWSGPNTFTSDDTTHEYPGRTFAIIELAVLKQYRCHGIGRELHSLLIAGLTNERVTLLVRPEAEAAQAS